MSQLIIADKLESYADKVDMLCIDINLEDEGITSNDFSGTGYAELSAYLTKQEVIAAIFKMIAVCNISLEDITNYEE